MRSLLDINVLIALFDTDHVHHSAATRWLGENIEEGWASCPLTQNGCVRIMSQPSYPNALPMQQTIAKLEEATSTTLHSFLKDSVSLLDKRVIDHSRLLNPRQLTDIYLLALAAENGCRLVTFDQSVPLAAARKARKTSLLVI